VLELFQRLVRYQLTRGASIEHTRNGKSQVSQVSLVGEFA
jgi:hypothetical protein